MVGEPYRWACESGLGRSHDATHKFEPPVAHPKGGQITYTCLPCASTLGLLAEPHHRIEERP